MEVRDGVIYQCHEGHCFCAECDGSIENRLCPICREALPERPIRNRMVERQIAALPATCGYCAAATTRGEKEAHERDCPQRPRQCAAAEAGCAWSGLLAAKDAHEAACPHVIAEAICRRAVAPLRAQNEQLQARVAALEPLRAENVRLRARVETLEEAGEAEGRRQRQRVGPAPHDPPAVPAAAAAAPHGPPPTNAAIGEMDAAAVLAALRDHMADARVAEAACMRLYTLSGVRRGNRQSVLERLTAVFAALGAAMRAHPQAARLQEWGCMAVHNVCSGADGAAARWQRAADAGMLEAAATAVRNCPGTQRTVASGLMVVFSMCDDDELTPQQQRAYRLRAAAAGVKALAERTLADLEAHPGRPQDGTLRVFSDLLIEWL